MRTTLLTILILFLSSASFAQTDSLFNCSSVSDDKTVEVKFLNQNEDTIFLTYGLKIGYMGQKTGQYLNSSTYTEMIFRNPTTQIISGPVPGNMKATFYYVGTKPRLHIEANGFKTLYNCTQQ